PAGVGKSRLARHAVQAAERDGALTDWAQATRSAAAIPLGALAGVVPADVRSDEPLELMRRSADALRERAGGRRVVLGVDDAQLLDPSSAALVLQLTTSGAAFVVVTMRTGEPVPDAVRSLWKDAGAIRMELTPLTEEATATLVESVLGGPVEQRARRWLYRSTRGNPLYLRELLIGCVEAAALKETGGIWRLGRTPAPSASLSELVGARMEGLAADERRAIEYLALGEPLRLAEIVALAGTDALAGAEAHGLVAVEAIENVRLAHPLYGEVLRASMPVVRAAAIRRELARLVGERPERDADDALRIARWLLDAGEAIAQPLLLSAARAATVAGDADLGARLAALALDGGAGWEAALLLARAHAVRDRNEEAEAALAAIEGAVDDREAAIGYLQRRTTVLYWGLQRMDDALALLARARGWWPDDGWRQQLEPLRLHLVSIQGGFGGTLAVTSSILDDPQLEPAARRRTELVHIVNLFYSGRVREARELLVGRLPPVPLRDEYDELACIMWCVLGLEAGWDMAAVVAWMERALARALEADDHGAAGIAATTLGSAALLAGRFADAARWYAEACVHLELHDPFQLRKSAHALQVGVAYFTGDAQAAAVAAARMRAAIGEREVIDTDRAYVLRGEAWLALAEGDPPQARRILVAGAERMAGVPTYAAQLYHDALRAGAPARPLVAPLNELRARCDGRLAAAYAGHAEALAAADGTRLLGCADEFEDIGTLRLALECAAEASAAFAAADRQDSARRAARRMRDLDRGQGGFLPAIPGLDDASITLTAREAQLVELAARGLSNADIADRLVLSVRTVESHLYRAMQKLGVSDRRELRSGTAQVQ
ncbi:MAG TPA: LuxR C-terminal-related transcriptional regulator, partial [Solirubrobacter sp.]|nr:LuxR C-terminal-related transcriptional regulator [Solirubrobacter sp.]